MEKTAQKQVKIINFKANNFGIFNALELDFEKFKNGVIAIKGGAGEGKSTIQKGVKLSTQGRGVLDDADQYGNEWETETQLVDGERKIFIGASKKDGKSIEFKLYEKDSEGKKVFTPVIDGVKATPAKYMDVISTELTFGIKDFLNENNTVHKKFMFALFRPELEKLGVDAILKDLGELTVERDRLRSLCQHKGAFMADFERDGWKKEALDALVPMDLQSLEVKRNNILIEQGKSEGDGNAEYTKARGEKAADGLKVVEIIRTTKERLENAYALELGRWEKLQETKNTALTQHDSIISPLKNQYLLHEDEVEKIKDIVHKAYLRGISECEMERPLKPITPQITDGKLSLDEMLVYEPAFKELIDKYKQIAVDYANIKPENFTNSRDFARELETVDAEINRAKSNNGLIDRYNTNRDWIEACAKVDIKRGELAKLYAQVDTGVEGLKMKPFFDEESGKVDIKTVYLGGYDPKFFHNDGTDERLLVSYSSTQRPIIGILLQVARLKKKAKALPYIFLDDVPMDKASLALISKIAEENSLTVITSITGDFDKDKLAGNEMLVEGGEVFF